MAELTPIESFADHTASDGIIAYAEAIVSADFGEESDRPQPAYVEQFIGVVRTRPCESSSTSDYTDARYYVDRAYPTVNPTLTGKTDALPGLATCLTATNLAEVASATHLLAAGTIVQLFALYTRQTPAKKIYVFTAAPGESVIVKITGNTTGGGEYTGRLVGGSSSASASSTLAMPAGLIVANADDALILNSEEDGQSGHRLKSGAYANGIAVGQSSDSPARTVVLIRGGVGETAGATVLGGTSEGSETADSATWSRATDGTPLNLYVVTRTVYNEAGDKTLYQFVRALAFDARGLLLSVGAETRVTIDATESCP